MWPWRFWISGDSEDVPPLVVQVSVSLVRQGVPPTASAPLQVSLPLSPREGTEKVPFFYNQNGKCLRFVTSLSANRLK